MPPLPGMNGRGSPYPAHRKEIMMFRKSCFVLTALVAFAAGQARAEEPDLIFKKSTVWKFLTPDDKLATYGIDDPVVNGVACHFTVPEKGGVAGMFGVA